MLSGYWHFTPEVLVVCGAFAALFGGYLPGKDRGAAYAAAGAAALAAAIVAFGGTGGPIVFGQLEPDSVARYARTGLAGLTAVWVLWVAGRGMPGERRREGVALALFATAGGMLLSMAEDLIVMFVTLELATMPAYVLMGYRRKDVSGLKRALDYFVDSILASVIVLYGLSFLYGISGSTAFSGLELEGSGMLGFVAVMLTLVGLFAKVSAAPLRHWTLDANAKAAPVSLAFVSTVPRVAGIVVMSRLILAIAASAPAIGILVGVAAAASMIAGNCAALSQGDLRRLLICSGIAHLGYLMMALAAGTETGYGAAVFYAVAYAVPSMGVMLVVAEEGVAIGDFARLASRRPWVAWSMVLWLLSLIGIPPLAGFFGKLYLIGAALQAELMALVLLAILATLLSAAYYFRIVREMFFGDEDEQVGGAIEPSHAATVALALCAVATVAIGIGAPRLIAALGVRFG